MKKNQIPTLNDIETGTKKELMKTYNLNPTQIEQAIRLRMKGKGRTEFESQYKEFYGRK